MKLKKMVVEISDEDIINFMKLQNKVIVYVFKCNEKSGLLLL